MNSLSLFLVSMAFSFSALAQNKLTQVDADTATLKIETHSDHVQAAQYADGAELKEFIMMLLNDKNSKLSQLKKQIELENCATESTPEEPWIDTCGTVQMSQATETAFGRGGWASGGAVYSIFVGFRSAGTGRFLSMDYIFNISEEASADVKPGTGEYAGTVTKTYQAIGSTKLAN